MIWHPSDIIADVAPNPKRKGTGAADRYENYRVGLTLQQALDSGVTKDDIRWDLKQGFVKVEVPHGLPAQIASASPVGPREDRLAEGRVPVTQASWKMVKRGGVEKSYVTAVDTNGERWTCIQDYLTEGLAEIYSEEAQAFGIDPKWWRRELRGPGDL